MIVKSEKPLSEAEQNALQGQAFVTSSGAPFAEDNTARNWHFGGLPPKKQTATGPRDAQIEAQSQSVLESSK